MRASSLITTEEAMKASKLESDGIINVPQELMHEILCRLTMRDVARTSCVSKAWRSLCVSLPFLNFDQREVGRLRSPQFSISDAARRIREQGLVIWKFRLKMDAQHVEQALNDIESCVSLVTKTNKIKEFDFQVMNDKALLAKCDKLFGHIYDAESLTMLTLSGLKIVPPSRDIKFFKLEISTLEDVKIDKESLIGELCTSCPMITEIRLMGCYGLKHLEVCGLDCLKRLEIGFYPELESVEIMAKGLEKLVLSEIVRTRFDEFHLGLTIDSQTCEVLRELTLCNSTLKGITFSNMFSNCSNVESLMLDYCVHFYKITIPITHQELRRLVIIRCFYLIKTEIKTLSLSSFSFCSFLSLDINEVKSHPHLFQYCEEISLVQECMLDFNQRLLHPKYMDISLV